MPKQGSVALLQEPLALELLAAGIPAHLAYTWKDGTPRVVPMWFHWTGDAIAMVCPPDSSKLKVIKDGTPVTVSIDYEAWPARLLSVRGTATTQSIEGEAEFYDEMVRKYLGDGTDDWRAMYRKLCPTVVQLIITPEWVSLIDVAHNRFPNALEKAMAAAG